MSDISEFLQSYTETLRQEIADADMPPGLTERFAFDSCVKNQDGRAVYFVTQKSDDTRAVLRVTDADCSENAAAEAAILAKLDHPAIPKTLSVWERGGRGYLVREYFDGDELNNYIHKHGTLTREQLLDIVLQLCDVLSYIHSQSPAVIHRDIKPENIILSGKDGVRLIDFGIARDFRQEAENDTQIAGTKPYMAPEQFGSEQTDGRADIYSLGVAMIFMATGKPDKQDLKKNYPYKELISVIEKCIRKDRDQRFRTAAQLKKRILRLRHHTIRKMLMGAVACVVIAAAFALGLYFGQVRGFQQGVDSIMNVPTVKNQLFTQEELLQPIAFDSWYLDMAVRTALNKQPEDTIYRTEIVSRFGEIRIYGTYILHPELDDVLLKTHIGKGTVAYITNTGFRIDTRGDVSSLDGVPNMYYLRTLSLTSQSIADLSPLSGMKLENINLCDNFVGNLLPLKDMVTLKILDLCQNPLRDLTPISRLLSLEYLDISQTQVTDLKPLADLTKLQTLNLCYCDVSDIRIVAKLSNLRELDISHTAVTDLAPLLGRKEPLAVRCAGLPDEVVTQIRNAENITIVEEI